MCVLETTAQCVMRENEVLALLSLSFFSLTVYDVTRKLDVVETYSTVRKRAKRMPDTFVETTIRTT